MKKLISITLFSVLFFSCNKNEGTITLGEKSVEQTKLIQEITNYLGYDETEIEFDKIQGKIYVEIQGDMLFEIDQIKENIRNVKSALSGKRAIKCDEGILVQRCTSFICRRNRNYNKYYQSIVWVYFSSNIPPEWKEATKTAIEKWNALSNTIQFEHKENCYSGDVRYNNGVTIYLEARYGEDQTALARAIIGTKTNHKKLFINTAYESGDENYNNLSQLNKEFTMAHELGHTIGYKHTDALPDEGCHIEGTSMVDVNSLMRSVKSKAVVTENFFTGEDKKGHLILYPPQLENSFTGQILYQGKMNARCN